MTTLAAPGRAATRPRPTVVESISSLGAWVDAGVFGPAEVHGAEVVCRAATTQSPLVHLAAAFALWAPLHGHACFDLGLIAELVRTELAVTDDAAYVDSKAGSDQRTDSLDAADRRWRALPWPDPVDWIEALRASEIVRCVDGADPVAVLDERPLVLRDALLYTQRQWTDECSVAAHLLGRVLESPVLPVSTIATMLLERLLASVVDGEADLQHQAARAVLSSPATVIVGGPGTGKTHTVARALAVLLADAKQSGTTLKIALAAPTGKAAARLRDALASAATAGRDDGTLTVDQAAELGEFATTTVHRLLRWRGSTTRFAHDGANPLPFDVVIIDEASMVALPLMARLLEAVRPEARLVLVGDPDQLYSIEVGSVLADVVAASTAASPSLAANVIRLQRPRRHRAGSAIGPLADAVRDGRAAEAIELLRAGSDHPADGRSQLRFIEHADPLAAIDAAGVRDLVAPTLLAAAGAARAGDAAAALALFSTVRVLCAHRRGPYGAEGWNRVIESWVLSASPGARPTRFYPGRALLATRNDRRQRVANGDTGIVVADALGTRAAFGTADGLRLLSPAQLERVETAFATTIHKSQGSEYATVVVVLPPAGSALAGRELLYTALTRSTERLVVVGTQAAFVACVQTPTRRVSGLVTSLQSAPGER
ncbi:MAG: exodeoxyribonuclease V subunit alpha [Ilumatobacteraceae bacterium]